MSLHSSRSLCCLCHNVWMYMKTQTKNLTSSQAEMSVCVLKGGYCAYVVSTKISASCTNDQLLSSENFSVMVFLSTNIKYADGK